MRLNFTIAVLLFSVSFSFAQKELYNNTQKQKLALVSKEITQQKNTNYQKALKIATQKPRFQSANKFLRF